MAHSKPRFRTLSHTADVAVRIYGDSLAELFENAGAALVALVLGNPRSVRPAVTRDFYVEGLDREDLLIRWLNDLIYALDGEGFAGREFRALEVGDRYLRASVTGEPFDPARHHAKLEIKAATYHALEVTQDPTTGRWSARVVFDV